MGMADKWQAPRIEDQIQGHAEQYYMDAMAQVNAFRDRWQTIYDREDARWHQAGKEWKLAKEPDGQPSWKPYPKTVEATIQDYKAASLAMNQEREARTYSHAQRDTYGR
jgi:hypothetical protein